MSHKSFPLRKTVGPEHQVSMLMWHVRLIEMQNVCGMTHNNFSNYISRVMVLSQIAAPLLVGDTADVVFQTHGRNVSSQSHIWNAQFSNLELGKCTLITTDLIVT